MSWNGSNIPSERLQCFCLPLQCQLCGLTEMTFDILPLQFHHNHASTLVTLRTYWRHIYRETYWTEKWRCWSRYIAPLLRLRLLICWLPWHWECQPNIQACTYQPCAKYHCTTFRWLINVLSSFLKMKSCLKCF